MTSDVGAALRLLGRTQVRSGDSFTKVADAPGFVQQRSGLVVPDRFARGVDTPTRRKGEDVAIKFYYPVGHPRLHVVDHLNLDAIGPVGRTDEVSTLRTCILVPPTALAGEFTDSPGAGEQRINTHRAFCNHAWRVRELLKRGTTVYLLRQPVHATEGSFATDIATAIGNDMVLSSPLLDVRRAELAAYSGGQRIDDDGRDDGPIEWGDVLQATRDGVHYVMQGWNSMRGTEQSLERLERYLFSRRKEGKESVHVPIHLDGADTLHHDYAAGVAGKPEDGTRCLLVAPHAFADKNELAFLQWIFEASDQNVKTVTKEEMLAGACNISCLNPREVFQAEHRLTEGTGEFMRSRNINVLRHPYEHGKKSGNDHCGMGQALRAE